MTTKITIIMTIMQTKPIGKKEEEKNTKIMNQTKTTKTSNQDKITNKTKKRIKKITETDKMH